MVVARLVVFLEAVVVFTVVVVVAGVVVVPEDFFRFAASVLARNPNSDRTNTRYNTDKFMSLS